ncbi:MAG: nucleotidyl transferase AbiEii/AbiGii toxin family protein [Propioniciclava sp.]|uniref:nucleotidyl transferase AbiEii/AbiGii toxin family protein n=1 Tax=Propioniciclava sp. TaxID=2038686 RepID=UPI0039E2C465
MKDFHRRLATVSLRALEEYGFVLAGGYAISAHGIGDRPSLDVDLFTSSADQGHFDQAVAALRQAFDTVGLVVTDKRIRPLFVDIDVADPNTGERSDLQLGMNYREFPPHRIDIGPVPGERLADHKGACTPSPVAAGCTRGCGTARSGAREHHALARHERRQCRDVASRRTTILH